MSKRLFGADRLPDLTEVALRGPPRSCTVTGYTSAKTLFGGGAKGSGGTTAGRKRKRNDGPQMCVEGLQGRVKVVGDEFVVQSLISGALVD